jgi:GntR family transcriptional regulator
MTFGLFLSATDKKPMYLQIVEQITQKVMLGDWPSQMALPSIRELAAETQVSVITVKRAYAELEIAGVIKTQAGRGSFVASHPDLQQQLKQQQLQQQLAQAIDLAQQLQFTDAQFIELVQQQWADMPIGSQHSSST